MIAEKLETSGLDTTSDQLYVAAVQAMQATDLDVTKAAPVLVKALYQNPKLLKALAENYLGRVIAPDMRFRREPDGGHASHASLGQKGAAPDSSASDGGAGQVSLADTGHIQNARDTSSREMGQHRHANTGRAAHAPTRDETLRRSVRIETAKKEAAAYLYRLPDGRVLADLKWSELAVASKTYRIAAAIVDQVHRHARVIDLSRTVRDIVKARDLETFIANAERANAEKV